jgi:membrane associated rhomboid family serine protease
LNSKDYKTLEGLPEEHDSPSSWVKVGAVAAISALAGGLAATWFYRKTLRQIQIAESEAKDSNFRTDQYPDDEI